MSETETKAPAKAPVERTEIQMDDGRKVSFAGKRQADKTVEVNADNTVTVRVDFRNGKTVALTTGQLAESVILQAIGHGLSQKIGDEYSGEKDVDDMALAAEDMVKRLLDGDWSKAREAGDGFSGASVVIRAICEATGKDVDFVKKFLQGKLDAAKAKGEKLTRNELYASFRNPASKTGAIIKRLEEEKLTKASKVNSDELLGELA